MTSLENFLKKQIKAHKYLFKLTRDDIHHILAKHVLQLKKIQPYALPKWPDVYDEYLDMKARIVENARSDMKSALLRKLKIPAGSACEIGLRNFVASL